MTLMDELVQQPDALRNLVDYYIQRKDLLDLCKQFPYKRLVLSGMGASFHAAWIASYTLNRLGIPASAVESSDMLHYGYGLPGSTPDRETLMVLISQSGSSGEISALLENPSACAPVVGITNQEGSVLADKAQIYLPMVAGDEGLIASKTYLNTLALLWILGRSLAGEIRAADFDALKRLADRVQELLNSAQSIRECLVPVLEESRPFMFLGHGPHGVTARQSAMIMGEWAKLPALHYSIGAFRHGYIEIAENGFGAVVFAPPGSGAESARALAGDLVKYGVRVVVIENGNLRDAHEMYSGHSPVDEFFSPMLDIIPVQVATEALARSRGFGESFRYIDKVVTKL